MSLQERLQRQMIGARQLSERLLADFKSPQQWTHQVCDGANHPLWFVGHMANTDNFFLSLVAPELAQDKPDYGSLFGMGSRPSASAGDYPPVEELLAYMRERRQTLLSVLEKLSDDDFSRATPDGAPDFLADFGSVFETAIWHEGLHSGQLSMVRRTLGYGPVMGEGGS